MQEDLENKTLLLIVNSTKFTGRTLKTAVSAYLAHQKNMIKHGKQSIKKLVGQGKGVSNQEFDSRDGKDVSIHRFDRIAKKYGVDYAIKKDKSVHPPRYLLFFKSQDSGAITEAFREYNAEKIKKESRPSVLQRLEHFRELALETAGKVKKKVLER